MEAQSQSQETSWLPQDDILLKNAVEAGVSFESLAKGAENFSQRFTVEELQDRWNGLLYDPLVSAEASARMTEIDVFLQPLKPEYRNGVICCVLNTEDPYIPFNDDVFLQPLNEMVEKAEQANCPSNNLDGFCFDKQAGDSDHLKIFSENNGIGSNQEAQNPVTILNEETFQADVDPTESIVPDLAATHSPANQDEFPAGNEDDVPCYSDVEAMILDMDLSRDDQDFYPRRNVLKYKPEDTKRRITRLEQTAAACMQRICHHEEFLLFCMVATPVSILRNLRDFDKEV